MTKVFKLAGQWWKVRRYRRKGRWRYCYAPTYGYEPIFSDRKLTREEILERL